MEKFTDDHLKAYIEALFKKHNLGEVTVLDGTIKQHERCIEFQGLAREMRKPQAFVLPIFSPSYGVISARSVLHAANRHELSWMINGQSLNSKTKELMHIGEGGISLHISRDMLKAWTHGRLENAPSKEKHDQWLKHFDQTYSALIEKGLYGEKVSVGDYVDLGPKAATLKLRLQPLEGQTLSFELDTDAAYAAPSM